ncbi:MAG: ABC transporter ATP-binding protein/permease [Phycisphaerales bacterium]|nr:ABC transporter ATP-binding protein/permease [Phycisphaerales bacterium]
MSQGTPHVEDVLGTIDRGLWRRIASHGRSYSSSAVAMVIGGILIAVVESMLPLVTGWLVDAVVDQSSSTRMTWLGILYVGLCVGFCVLVWWFIVSAGRLATGLAHDLRQASFKRLQQLEFGYFDLQPAGWLVSRLTSDCRKVASLMPWFLLDLCWGITFLILVATAMLLIDYELALYVMTIVPILVLVTFYFQGKLLRSSRLMRKTNSELTAVYNEGIMGVRTTKSLTREQENLSEFQVVSDTMHRHSMTNAIQTSIFLPIVTSVGSIGVGIALWAGGLQIADGEGLSIGMLVAFMQYAVLFAMPVQELAARLSDLKGAQAAAERIQGLLDRVPAIRDSDDVLERMREMEGVQSEERAIDGGDTHISTIEFKNVSFWYKQGEPVLLNLDLTIRPKETIALVGPTGGGKTTIASLLCRFYEPCEGGVYINDVEYRKRSLHWLQSNLGIVLQHPHLFSGTVAENISYGMPGVSRDRIIEAAMQVEAHGFIEQMPQGYDSEVGEGGGRLSIGQRQLIALARAVLAEPQVFVMDEATSSVDTETEHHIQQGIEAALADRIAVVIAHRLSTVRSADRILVVESGQIVEQGSHAELLEAGGAYRELYRRHFAGSS